MCDIPFIVIVGLGLSGKAVALFARKRAIPMLVVDDKPEVAKAWIQEQQIACEVLDGRVELSLFCTLVPSNAWCVCSPGIPPDHPIIAICRKRSMLIMSEIDLALRLLAHQRPKIIAVTGTNGKTTVCELICHLFNHAGKTCEALGNIGTPVIQAIEWPKERWPEWVVIEISSFQLETTSEQLFTVGCWLNIAPNHLDWHKTMEQYRAAKQKLSRLVVSDGLFLRHHSLTSLDSIPKTTVWTFGREEGEVTIRGEQIVHHHRVVGSVPDRIREGFPHDRDNYLAAFAIGLFAGIDPILMEEGYDSFKKPSHRIEFIGKHKNISYFDDSKGTNIAATAAAVAAVPGPVVLIAGGVHKGFPYTSWKKAFSGKVRAIVAIGQAKELIAKDVGDEIPVHLADTMQQAVDTASTIISEPYSVVLSPGCSSYDMFRDYKERGDRFQESVRVLAARSL